MLLNSSSVKGCMQSVRFTLIYRGGSGGLLNRALVKHIRAIKSLTAHRERFCTETCN